MNCLESALVADKLDPADSVHWTRFILQQVLGRGGMHKAEQSIRLLLAVFAIGLVVLPTSRGDEPDFETQIAPLLQQHCLRCHSPGINKGGISLATVEDLSANDYLSAGDPGNSYLLELVTSHAGVPPEMPQDGPPLTDGEVELLSQWIDAGAQWPNGFVIREKPKADSSWWSLQPVQSMAEDISIDQLIQRKLDEQGLQMNPPADRRTLIRRATYDLTGLPPTPDEVDAFVKDPDPNAYSRLIDRLLASPRYGERWGRHWLDVVRFGESNGFERNVIINNLWPFRDYVIKSLNQDKPFDQFITEHLAGDVIEGHNPDTAVGTAFLVAGPYDDVGNQDAAQAAQIRANTLDEMIRASSQAFLGMTVGCARCHDHKFDPITQEDYYALYATFASVRHGSVPLATTVAKQRRTDKLRPLQRQKRDLEQELAALRQSILGRAKEKLSQYEAHWVRPAVARTGTEELFPPVKTQWVRLVCESQDSNPNAANGFRIDEFEIFSSEEPALNVALASNGAKAFGDARKIEDFSGAYGPELAIDGQLGARFISTGNHLTIQLPKPTSINRVLFSSARNESTPGHSLFIFVAEYRIEISDDGQNWKEVASGADRQPINRGPYLDHRLLQRETSASERKQQAKLRKSLNQVNRDIAQVSPLPTVWIGTRTDTKGPFHVFVGGNPQRQGGEVVPASLSGITGPQRPSYRLMSNTNDADRRRMLAQWIVHPDNPLTSRVLANRVWHYHFGTGIVNTPSDFGYMGGRPTHPELLDLLADRLKSSGWRLKSLHRMIMLSNTYQQSSKYQPEAAKLDADARWLWRFPPRRLSAEEIRDTVLQVAGKLDLKMGGPGFRLYRYLQDNVSTYVPLDLHGPETYRRAVYHQNARASVVDLMTEFDQPDCAFSTPRRAETTTPLQALTMLNHSFTLDMASALAARLANEQPAGLEAQINQAYRLMYLRVPTEVELKRCLEFAKAHDLASLCRVLLNTSELIYVE